MMIKSGEVSKTAAFIAIKFRALMQVPEYQKLFDKKTIAFYDHQISHFPQRLRQIVKLTDLKKIRDVLISLEEWILPGDLLHILTRKWYLHNTLKAVIDKGCRQIIVLGAGFDHLAYCAAQTGMIALEIDKPATSLLKKKIVTHYSVNSSNLIINSCSGTAESIMNIIRQNEQLNPNKKVFIVTEGFWDYQSEHNNKILAQQLAGYFKAGIRIASTVFNLNKLTPFHRFIFEQSIRLVGEQLTFLTSKKAIANLFKNHGITTIEFQQARDLKKRTIPSAKSLKVLKGFGMIQLQR